MYMGGKAVVPYKPVSTPFPVQPTYAQKVAVSSNAFMNAMNARPQTLQVRPTYNVPIKTIVQPSGVKLVQYNPTGAYYPQTPQSWPNMLATGMNGFGDPWHAKSFPFGAAPAAALAPAASGAAIGTAIFPGIGTAIGALIGGAVGLLGPSVHHAPAGFLYDDYPQHIWENEVAIVNLNNALARYTGGPAPMGMPPMYQKTGGPQYQASMQAIVPRYVPGSESQIASYNRKLNEAGGAYEKTFALQTAIIGQMQQALQSAQQSGAAISPSVPATGSATAPAPYGGPGPAGLMAPPLMPQLQPGPTMAPYSVLGPLNTSPAAGYSLSPTYNAPAGVVTSDMFGSMGQYMPYILGGVGLVVMLMQGKGGGMKTVYRSRPRSRRRK